MVNVGSIPTGPTHGEGCLQPHPGDVLKSTPKVRKSRDLLGIVVQPLDLHLVWVASIPTGPTHGEERLQQHPGDVLKSTLNVRKSPRSGLNLEGKLSDPQIFSTARIRSHIS